MNDQEYTDTLLDERHNDIVRRLEDIRTTVNKNNSRLSKLEKWRNRIVGAIAVITTLLLPIVISAAENLIL